MKKSVHMVVAVLTVAVALSVAPPSFAQDAGQPATASAEKGLYATAFRSPATGVEYRFGRMALHAGYYVTIVRADAQTTGENTNFVRAGGTFYLRSSGWTPYVSPSLVLSLDDDWDNGVLTEVGVRFPLFARASLRGGVGVLQTFDGETRVNPTIGVDVRLGKR